MYSNWQASVKKWEKEKRKESYLKSLKLPPLNPRLSEWVIQSLFPL